MLGHSFTVASYTMHLFQVKVCNTDINKEINKILYLYIASTKSLQMINHRTQCFHGQQKISITDNWIYKGSIENKII